MRRMAALGAVLMIVLAGCDSDPAASPSPSSSTPAPSASAMPSVTSSPSPTAAPAPPSADEVVALVVDPWNAALTSDAPAGELPTDLVQAVDAATVPDSQAQTFLMDRLSLAFDPATRLRGDVVGAATGPVDGADGVATVPACLSAAFEATEGDASLGSDGRFVSYEVTATLVDGVWRVRDVVEQSDDDVPASCLPPDVAQAVEADADEFIATWDAFWAAPTDDGAAADLAAVSWADVEPWDEAPWTVERTVAVEGPELVEATRTVATLRWCEGPDIDPDGGYVLADGTRTPFTATALVGEFRLDDGRWLGPGEPLRARTAVMDDQALGDAFAACFS